MILYSAVLRCEELLVSSVLSLFVVVRVSLFAGCFDWCL